MRFNKGFTKVSFIAPVVGAAARMLMKNPGSAVNAGLNVLGATSDYKNIKSQLASKVRT